MSRRWINSIDVEFDPIKGSILIDQASPGTFIGGTKTVPSSATPQPLVATPTPCRFVWIGARVDNNGSPLNAYPCFVGDASNQNIPVMPANFEGVVLRVDDAAKVFVRVVSGGSGVVYRLFA